MSAAYGKGWKGKATRLHSKIIRSLGWCQRCGSPNNLQAAHIIGRSATATRCLLDNAWCLCAKCHFELTNDPYLHVQYAYETIGEDRYHELRRLGNTVCRKTQADWEDVYRELEAHAAAEGIEL